MYQKKCKRCGAYLDPEEKCDCLEETERRITELTKLYQEDKATGQIKMKEGM